MYVLRSWSLLLFMVAVRGQSVYVPPDGTFSSNAWEGGLAGVGGIGGGGNTAYSTDFLDELSPASYYDPGDYYRPLYPADLITYTISRYSIPQVYESELCNLTHISMGQPFFSNSWYVRKIRCNHNGLGGVPAGMHWIVNEYDTADYIDWYNGVGDPSHLQASFETPGLYYLPHGSCEAFVSDGEFTSEWRVIDSDFSVRIVDTTPPVMSSCSWNGTAVIGGYRQWTLPDVTGRLHDNSCVTNFSCTNASATVSLHDESVISVCTATDQGGTTAVCETELALPAFASVAVRSVAVYGTADKVVSLRSAVGTLTSCTVLSLPTKGTLLQTHDSALISSVPHVLAPPQCNVTFRPTPGPDFEGIDAFLYSVDTADRSASLQETLTLRDSAVSNCTWTSIAAQGRSWILGAPHLNVLIDDTPYSLSCVPYAEGDVLNVSNTLLQSVCTLTETDTGEQSNCTLDLQLPNFTVSTTPTRFNVSEGHAIRTTLSVAEGTITQCSFFSSPAFGHFVGMEDTSVLPRIMDAQFCTSDAMFYADGDSVGSFSMDYTITTAEFGDTELLSLVINVSNVVDPPVVQSYTTSVVYFTQVVGLRVNVTDVDPGVVWQNVTLLEIPSAPMEVYLWDDVDDTPLTAPTWVLRNVSDHTPQFRVMHPGLNESSVSVLVPLRLNATNNLGVQSVQEGIVTANFGASLIVPELLVVSGVEDANTSSFALTAVDALSLGNALYLEFLSLESVWPSLLGSPVLVDPPLLVATDGSTSSLTTPHSGLYVKPGPHGCGVGYATLSYRVRDLASPRISNTGIVRFDVVCVNDEAMIVIPTESVVAVNGSNATLLVVLTDADTPGLFESTVPYQARITRSTTSLDPACFAFQEDTADNITDNTVFHAGGKHECAAEQFWTGPLWEVSNLLQNMKMVGSQQTVFVTLSVWESHYEAQVFTWTVALQGTPPSAPTPAPTVQPTPPAATPARRIWGYRVPVFVTVAILIVVLVVAFVFVVAYTQAFRRRLTRVVYIK